jgi:hypothetical protein
MVAQMFNRAPQRARTATPLLAFIAGDFADAVAQLWPAPHAEFFALPAARRHASAIALAGLACQTPAPTDIRRLVEFQRDAVVAEAMAGDLATGLMRALSKAGETLWRREHYATFLQLMADPMANEVLRHLEEVRPDTFAPLAALPPALRVAPIVRVMLSAGAAADLARAFQLAVLMREPGSGARIARRWGAGGEVRQVFMRAYEDMTPDVFRPAPPAPVLDPPFVRIANRKQLEEVAREFRNCLADHGGRLADGKMAAYVWGETSEAVIALTCDAAGWRLAEAKARDNVDLEDSILRELVRRLELVGVRTGPSVQWLMHRLDDRATSNAYPLAAPGGFLESLSLGDLWS